MTRMALVILGRIVITVHLTAVLAQLLVLMRFVVLPVMNAILVMT